METGGREAFVIGRSKVNLKKINVLNVRGYVLSEQAVDGMQLDVVWYVATSKILF